LFVCCVIPTASLFSQNPPPIPKVYEGLNYNFNDELVYRTPANDLLSLRQPEPRYTLRQMREGIRGTADGLGFDFADSTLNGTLYYGFIAPEDAEFPQPVFFKKPVEIRNGTAEIDILNNLSGKYDMIGWAEKGRGLMGYRVVDKSGHMLYDGKVPFTGTGPFRVGLGIVEGPFLCKLTDQSATLRFTLNAELPVDISLRGPGASDLQSGSATVHEAELTGLEPGTEYTYTISFQGEALSGPHTFRTAPAPGSRQGFTFAYCSDSRAGKGGGERDIHGSNAYIMKRIFALAQQEDAAFVQFSGDLINGYLGAEGEQRLQYANWKRAVEPFCATMPTFISMGNHEALVMAFEDANGKRVASIDRFPFETESAEAIFAAEFCNPSSELASEDGAEYDPDPNATDFPPYDETVFSYTYDNVAVIVLNSDYLYTPSLSYNGFIGGNLHAYIMDNQLTWLEQELGKYESDEAIDHVFVTQHTPAFPNGGHAKDDMWYHGDNAKRPIIDGQPVADGIIERRDDYLDLLINESSKVRAILTGDEHNYNRFRLTAQTPIYPEDWDKERLDVSREIWQINNGAAGAPYYAQEELPWSGELDIFSTQNALVLFRVEGQRLEAVVKNPDTLEEIDRFTLSE
jgi:hypothetical protein